jgi:hypothetical protein
VSRPRKTTLPADLHEKIADYASRVNLADCHKKQPKYDGPGDAGYLQILDEMREMHIAKSTDYGNSKKKDPLANLRASERFGVAPWLGAVIRLNDKITRIESFIENGRLMNESVEDSFMDIAAYAILALLLYREEYEACHEPPRD